MSHLTDRTLEALITGSATPSDIQRLRRHVEGCRACSRRLEEWRDNFADVDQRYPELALDSGPTATVASDGLVFLPSTEAAKRFEVDLTTGLWIGAVVMAVLVGYGTYRLRQTREVVDAATLYPQLAEPESRRAAAMPPTSAPETRDTAVTRPEPPKPKPVVNVLPVSPGFKSVRFAEAARKLGGPVRLIRGMEPDHAELGPASAVPGALPDVSVIRVVYQAFDGSRMVLDQQLTPKDSSGFRPILDPSLEGGQVRYESSPSGISVATWLDDVGYRISLAGQVSADSLRAFVKRVH
jgi:hypothetical protein